MARRPGAVFRVSSIVAEVPAIASTNWRVKVAIPDMRPRKLSAVRSPVRIARAGPASSSSVCPRTTRPPSETVELKPMSEPNRRNTARQTFNPDKTPSCRAIIRAMAPASEDTMLFVVTSPDPMSSLSAREIQAMMSSPRPRPARDSLIPLVDRECGVAESVKR